MTAEVRSRRWGDFTALELRSERVSIVVVPDMAGKVVSLLDRETGREWLVQVPPERLRLPGPTTSWVELDRSGWDECFPNISAGDHPDLVGTPGVLREQGDLWTRPWHTVTSDTTLHLTADGVVLPYRFDRSITVDGPRIDVRYVVRNDGVEPLRGMWAMHPLLAAVPGMRIEGIPATCWVDAAMGLTSVAGDRLRWPDAGLSTEEQLDLSTVPAPRAVAAKLFADRPAGAVVVHDLTGWLAFGGSNAVTHLGVWLNYGGWPADDPSYHLAIEPSIGGADDMARVVREGGGVNVAPGTTATWSVSLQVGRADEDPPAHWTVSP